MPALEPMLQAAAEARARGDWDASLVEYKRALLVIAPEEVTARASLYADIAEIKRAQGRVPEAELYFEKALDLHPDHVRSIDALITLAADGQDWARVVRFRKHRLRTGTDRGRRLAEYHLLADLCEDKLGDLPKAVEILEETQHEFPKHRVTLVRLRLAYERLHRWPELLEAMDILLDLETEPRRKAHLCFARADVFLGHLHDETRAIEALTQALAHDPKYPRALAALASLHAVHARWKELEALYESLARRTRKHGDAAWSARLYRDLARVRREALADLPGAADALRKALAILPDDGETSLALAEILVSLRMHREAEEQFENALTQDPSQSRPLRGLFQVRRTMGDDDGAWLVAASLSDLGTADVDHEMFAAQFQAEGLPRPKGAWTKEAWTTVRAPGSDDLLEQLLTVLAPFAIRARLEVLRRQGKLVTSSLGARLPASSTVTIVRAMSWASKLLDLPLPALHLDDRVQTGLAAVQAPEPTVAIGADLLSGRTPQALVFHAARHLTYFRPEHYALIFYPTLREFSALVADAIAERPERSHELPPWRSTAKAADLEQIASLGRAIRGRDAALDLTSWVQGVELTAARIGLVACGDVRTARAELRNESRSIAELPAARRERDLASFAVSSAHANVRSMLGIDVRSADYAASSMGNIMTERTTSPGA